MTLLHVALRRPAAGRDGGAPVLQGYRSRYAALMDAVTETEPTFRDDLLGDLAVVDLLTAARLRPRRPLARRTSRCGERQ